MQTRQIKVLCQFVAQVHTPHGPDVFRDSIMIEVARSAEIIEEFEVQLQKRRMRGYWHLHADQTKLVSYLPENGQRHFECEADPWQARLH